VDISCFAKSYAGQATQGLKRINLRSCKLRLGKLFKPEKDKVRLADFFLNNKNMTWSYKRFNAHFAYIETFLATRPK
jgi:hypothetical protein